MRIAKTDAAPEYAFSKIYDCAGTKNMLYYSQKKKGVRKMAFSAKQKCKKIQCTSCGRTLDRCVCQKNKDRGYVSRLYNYKKEQKIRKTER